MSLSDKMTKLLIKVLQGGKKETTPVVKKTFKTNPGQIAQEHDDEVLGLETQAMQNVAKQHDYARMVQGRNMAKEYVKTLLGQGLKQDQIKIQMQNNPKFSPWGNQVGEMLLDIQNEAIKRRPTQ